MNDFYLLSVIVKGRFRMRTGAKFSQNKKAQFVGVREDLILCQTLPVIDDVHSVRIITPKIF